MVQPDSSTVSLPAFFDGGTTWRVRHTPTMAGLYSISNITLNGSPLSFSNLSPASWTVTGFPTSPGFVRVDPANPRRFITSNGRRFFPVGQDVAWGYTNTSGGDYRVTTIFPKMGAAHENWSRVWMTHFYDWQDLGLNLDWPKVNNTFGQFSLTNARQLGRHCRRRRAGRHPFPNDLAASRAVFEHQRKQRQPELGTESLQRRPTADFFPTRQIFSPTRRPLRLTKRKLRYIVARWGYSPAIMACGTVQ